MFNSNTKEWEYSVGDVVWYPTYPLLIKCRITRLDDYFRKQHPTSYLFYDIDEPVGHSLAGGDFCDSLDDGKGTILATHKDWGKEHNLNEYAKTLLEHRKEVIDFVKGTWSKAGVDAERYAQMDAEFGLHCYPDKERGVEWFHILDLLAS